MSGVASSSRVIGPLRLIFWPAAALGSIVGDSSGLDDDGGLGKKLEHGVAHFFGGFDSRNFGGARRSERGWAADQKYARTTAQRGFGQGVSHAAAGAVGEIADGINLFARGTGGDQDGFAIQSCEAPRASSTAATMASFSARRPAPVMPQAR